MIFYERRVQSQETVNIPLSESKKVNIIVTKINQGIIENEASIVSDLLYSTSS